MKEKIDIETIDVNARKTKLETIPSCFENSLETNLATLEKNKETSIYTNNVVMLLVMFFF